jgi:uncharacterized DUF497 family protein
MDVALLVGQGQALTLVYMEIEDDVRVISFRHASREERKAFEQERKEYEAGQ